MKILKLVAVLVVMGTTIFPVTASANTKNSGASTAPLTQLADDKTLVLDKMTILAKRMKEVILTYDWQVVKEDGLLVKKMTRLRITQVLLGSTADKAGLVAGMEVKSIDGVEPVGKTWPKFVRETNVHLVKDPDRITFVVSGLLGRWKTIVVEWPESRKSSK